jgi:hypothetical protein
VYGVLTMPEFMLAPTELEMWRGELDGEPVHGALMVARLRAGFTLAAQLGGTPGPFCQTLFILMITVQGADRPGLIERLGQAGMLHRCALFDELARRDDLFKAIISKYSDALVFLNKKIKLIKF